MTGLCYLHWSVRICHGKHAPALQFKDFHRPGHKAGWRDVSHNFFCLHVSAWQMQSLKDADSRSSTWLEACQAAVSSQHNNLRLIPSVQVQALWSKQADIGRVNKRQAACCAVLRCCNCCRVWRCKAGQNGVSDGLIGVLPSQPPAERSHTLHLASI